VSSQLRLATGVDGRPNEQAPVAAIDFAYVEARIFLDNQLCEKSNCSGNRAHRRIGKKFGSEPRKRRYSLAVGVSPRTEAYQSQAA
jgi:hypothetical protein